MSKPRPSEEEVRALFEAKAAWHTAQARLPLAEKVRILLELEKQDYPLLACQRPLAWWEKPWDIEP